MEDTQNSNETVDISIASTEIKIPRVYRFWIFLLTNILSIICTLIIFFFAAINRKVRHSIQNHPLLVTLVIAVATQTIDVPLYLNFILNSSVVPRTPSTCLIWWFVDFGLFNGGIILTTWISFHRHLLVYHDRWIGTKMRRLFLHYIPLTSLVIYIFAFYIYSIYYFPCENSYDYSLPLCDNTPCYLDDPVLGMVDMLANSVIPSFLEAVFSFSFLFRFIWHRYHSNFPIHWRKQRRMAIQLMFMSFLNLTTVVPPNVLIIAHLCGVSQDVGVDVIQYCYFLSYFIPLLFPFICFVSLHGMRRELKKITLRIRGKLRRFQPVVEPYNNKTINVQMNHQVNGRM